MHSAYMQGGIKPDESAMSTDSKNVSFVPNTPQALGLK